jgi:ADP-L-glycero-D-manno-heptose 6-epimerase
MIIVTGGAGFVGSNIIEGLNRRGLNDILVVDHLVNGRKMHNLADLDIKDYLDRAEFLERMEAGQSFGKVEAVFHQGACSATTEWDGQFVMRNNFEYSKKLLHWCLGNQTQFLYASSASVYGKGERGFREDRAFEHPINMYAFSKFQFDQYVRKLTGRHDSQVVGFRYFNVYGPREAHKGSMASTAFHFNAQVKSEGRAKLFAGTDGYGDGEQRRDFVYVKDCVAANLWFFDHPQKSGIFNLGTGRASSFNEVAQAVLDWHGRGVIEYVPFPDHLRGAYQSHTQADLTQLREAGFEAPFASVRDGISSYLNEINGAHATVTQN